MFFNSNCTKILTFYTFDVHSAPFKSSFSQMFGCVVLDLNESALFCSTAENTKSVSLNVLFKAALYFYIFMAKKAYYNYKATRAAIKYSFKIKMASFNSLFVFYTKLFTDHKNTFISTKLLIAEAMPEKSFFRASVLLDGVLLDESSDLFQNLYKDIRSKTFTVSAKFAKSLILF